jgi:hypothetical protein
MKLIDVDSKATLEDFLTFKKKTEHVVLQKNLVTIIQNISKS